MNTFNTSVPQTHPDMQVDHAMSYNNMYYIYSYLIAAVEAMGDEGLTGNNIPTAMPLFMFAVRITQIHKNNLYDTTSPQHNTRQSDEPYL